LFVTPLLTCTKGKKPPSSSADDRLRAVTYLLVRIAAGCCWLKPVILATWEAEIGRITVQGQPRQIVQETLFPK
jgi:hypothetical protein